MSNLESPCHYCDHREMDCHSKCDAYKAYCSEIAKIHALKYAASEKEAQIKGYEHEKKQKKKWGKK